MRGSDVATETVAVDASGNEYIAGHFNGRTLNLGGILLTRIGVIDAFVAKRDPTGNVLWAKNYGGNGAEAYGKSVAVDSLGHAYLGGYFHGSLSTPLLTGLGYQDAYAIKLDASTGNTIWAQKFGASGGAGSTLGNALAIDLTGNVFLTGNFSNRSLTIPALTLVGYQDAFILKLDPVTGAVTWARNFGGFGSNASGEAIAVHSGKVFLGGYIGNADLTIPVVPRLGFQDAFVFELEGANGNILWTQHFGGRGAVASTQALAIDSSGNLVAGGDFYNANLTAPALALIGSRDAFVFRLDATTGATAWTQSFGGNGATVHGRAVAMDSVGNLYFSGDFRDADLSVPTLARVGVTDMFALKIDKSTGSTIWARNFGGTTGNYGVGAFGMGISADGGRNVHLAGFATGKLTSPPLPKIGISDAITLRLDSGTGAITRADVYGALTPGGTVSVEATAIDASGNQFIAGDYQAVEMTIGGTTLNCDGAGNVFVARLEAGGSVAWARNFGCGQGSVHSQAMAVDTSGNVYLAGYFELGLTTPPLVIVGARDAFVLKLDSITGAIIWARNFGGAAARAMGQALAVDESGNVILSGDFDSGSLTTPVLPQIGNQDAFALRLDSASGDVVWAKSFGSVGAYTSGKSLASDSAGNVYMGGSLAGADLATPPVTRIGNADAMVFKLDASTGATLWARNFGGGGSGAGVEAMTIDPSGSLYLGGIMSGSGLTHPILPISGTRDAFVIKLDAPTGTVAWAQAFTGGSSVTTYGYTMGADALGNVYLGGLFYDGNLTSPPLALLGYGDAFALKLDAATGTILRAQNFGGTGASVNGRALGADGAGNVYLGGQFNGANLTVPPLNFTLDADAFFLTPTHGVAYFGNGNSGGTAPIDSRGYWNGDAYVVADPGNLSRTGYEFGSWNTAANGSGTNYTPGATLTMAAANVALYARWSAIGSPPLLVSSASRKLHGTAGTFDLLLSSVAANPTTEPRTGPGQTIVMSFDKPIANADDPTVSEGSAIFGNKSIVGNDVILNFTHVNNAQYVTFVLTNVASAEGGGGTGSVRVGYLFGDANQSRQVSVSDVGMVNATLLKAVTLTSFVFDINADGKLTVADKGLANANLLKKLPAP